MNIRLIHPIAGVVAEFASAHEMIAYFVRKGREGIPGGAETAGLVFQVFQGGLIFQELLDPPAGPGKLPAQAFLCMPDNFMLH